MNNSWRTFLFILCFLIYAQCSIGQNHSFTDKYNLDFNLQNNKNIFWKIDQPNYFVIQVDSLQKIHGKNPLCIAQFKLGRNSARLKGGTIQQRILLPETKSDSITVYLNCKSKNLQQAQLIITGISDRECILYSDTLSILGSDEWRTFSRSVSLHNVRFLHLNIKAEGTKEVSEQCLCLDKIDLKIDGKDINDFPLSTISIIPDIKKSDIISLSLSDSNSFSKIVDLEKRKVIAIGETIHGSETITEAAVKLIKHQVEYNHCKLILLEFPTEVTFGWNRFIQGDSLFKIKDISQDLKSIRFSPLIMIDFCQWLKRYNEGVKDKVWLIGMDINTKSYSTPAFLYDYIYTLNKHLNHILLDSLCLKLYKYESFPKALQLIEKNKEIENLLGKNEFAILHHCLNMSIACGENTNRRLAIRDSLMYLNANFLLNLLCPDDGKVSIYTHFVHANYRTRDPSCPFNLSFGSYMKDKFGSDYYNIAVLTGEGNLRTSCNDSLNLNRTLEIPPMNSMENLFMQTNEKLCFITISTLPTQLMYIRCIGAVYQENQFIVIAPASRMDAAIFVRRSKSYDLLPGTPTSNMEVIDFESKRRIERFKQYKQVKVNLKFKLNIPKI